MSMTISAASYFDDIRQSTRTSNEEKLEQKQRAADAGKTQQSAVSASLDQVNMGPDGIAITEVSRQQGTEQSAAQKQPAASRMDSVEISAEGRAASARLQDAQTETGAAAAYQEETEDLSAYTDAELKQMYYKGEITLQEYEEETGEALE